MKNSLPHTSSNSYVDDLEDRLLNAYRKIVEKNDSVAAQLLKQKSSIQGEVTAIEPRNVKNYRLREYLSFWESLDEEHQYLLASHDAKLNHLARVIRNMSTTEVVQAHNSIKATTAGSFDYVIRRFREEGVTAEQLQSFIDENAVAWISLTGHPTNPTTVAYTKAQIDLAKIIADKNATSDDLMRGLQAVYDAPIVGPRKTPLDEAEETLATLNVIYDTAIPLKLFFEESLRKHDYIKEGVKISRPLIVPCAWTLGDGDGNENLTADVLEEGIKLHRKTIQDRYLKTLSGIEHSQISKIKEKILSAKDGPLLAKEIESLADGNQQLLDLAYLVKCFGLGFGTIDIRHNAIEIIDAAYRLADVSGIEKMEDLEKLDLDDAVGKITAWLESGEYLEKFKALKVDQFLEAGDRAAARIFGRLQVIGRNPDMCEKLIIAETTHPAHALAALLLLKVTGNVIGEEGSRIDLTILSESVKDLMGVGNALEMLLDNETFRNHVVSRGRLLVMIAKSDTTRQDGRGEAEYMQYETAVDIYRVADKMRKKYPALEKVSTSIKNGGGHALQRGGGRVTEIAALHGRAAADARVTDIGPSTLTIQGEQLTILLCPGKVALGTLEAFVSQNLYTKAGVRGEMPMPHVAKGINKQYAEADAWLYAKTAGKAFDKFTKKSKAIDNLLINAPWLSMKAGNVSSRPAKRGEKAVEPGVTPAEAKGEDPKALQGRAISGERLTAHACLPIFSVLGLAEAMLAVREYGQARANPHKYGDPLHHLYRAHKIHRDGARVTINAVTMADFDIAWPLLTGKIRPNVKKVALMAREFETTDQPSNELTLAYLEYYFLEVERLSYEMVSGQAARKSFRPGDALRKLWPELAEQVAHRDREAEFARVIEGYRTREFDKHEDTPLSELEFRITQALYASSNVVNAPVGILATRTRLEPVYEFVAGKKMRFMKPESFNESDVAELLKVPSALQ